MICAQGKGKGKGKGKSSKSSEVDQLASEVDSDSRRAEVVKLKALDVFAGCGGSRNTYHRSVFVLMRCI